MSALHQFEGNGPTGAKPGVVNNLKSVSLARRPLQRLLGDSCRCFAYLGQLALRELNSGKAGKLGVFKCLVGRS